MSAVDLVQTVALIALAFCVRRRRVAASPRVVVEVRAGDTLLLEAKGLISNDVRARIAADWAARGTGVAMVVVGPEMRLAAVLRGRLSAAWRVDVNMAGSPAEPAGGDDAPR